MAEDVYTNDIPRDYAGRPLILPPKGNGKRRPYRRVTRFIRTLEDTFMLDNWRMRMVALGMGKREDLQLAAASLTENAEDRKALQNVADKAMEFARMDKALMGTALHKIVERLDLGQKVPDVPAAYVKDIEAYERVRDRAGLKYGHIETMRVFDPWEVAGTPDRTGMYRGKWMIMDVKTGSVDYEPAQREIAMQLALYAHATAYDESAPGGPRIDDMPPVDRKRALVIHLPAGQGKCELHEVDIEKGWEGCVLAQRVWEWRKNKGVFTPSDHEDDAPLPRSGPQASNIYEAVLTCSTRDELCALWSRVAELRALDDTFKTMVRKRLEELEAGVAGA